jgi:putative transposase
MARKRQSHSAAFKAQVALAALKGDRTVNELAGQYGVHPTLIHGWKKQLLAGAADVFTAGAKPGNGDAEARQAELYEQIGRLKMEVMQAKVGAQEAELRTLRAQVKPPPAGKGKASLDPDNKQPHAERMWGDAEDALKALRGAKDDEKRRRLVEVLELLLRELRRVYPNADAPWDNPLRDERLKKSQVSRRAGGSSRAPGPAVVQQAAGRHGQRCELPPVHGTAPASVHVRQRRKKRAGRVLNPPRRVWCEPRVRRPR